MCYGQNQTVCRSLVYGGQILFERCCPPQEQPAPLCPPSIDKKESDGFAEAENKRFWRSGDGQEK